MAGFMPDRQFLKTSLSPFRLAGFAPEYSRTLTTVTQPSATCWQGSRTQLRLRRPAYEVVPHARWKLAHHGPRRHVRQPEHYAQVPYIASTRPSRVEERDL